MPEIITITSAAQLPKRGGEFYAMKCAPSRDCLLSTFQRRGWAAPRVVWHLSNASNSLWFAEQG